MPRVWSSQLALIRHFFP
jgi:hypothetical protein